MVAIHLNHVKCIGFVGGKDVKLQDLHSGRIFRRGLRQSKVYADRNFKVGDHLIMVTKSTKWSRKKLVHPILFITELKFARRWLGKEKTFGNDNEFIVHWENKLDTL